MFLQLNFGLWVFDMGSSKLLYIEPHVLHWYVSRPAKILMTKGRSHMHGQLDLESGFGAIDNRIHVCE